MMPGEAGSLALATIDDVGGLTVKQQKEWGEILTGWETRNRYQVLDDSGRGLLFAGEVGEGLAAVLMRGFLKNRRPFAMQVRASSGEVLLTLRRPWQWFFSRLEVEDGSGQLLGIIRQRFRWFTRHYDVEGPGGEVLATIEGPFFKPWTFIARQNGREICHILKKWSGFGKELFSTADTFRVEFLPELRDSGLRHLLFAATFLIDFVHFENREN